MKEESLSDLMVPLDSARVQSTLTEVEKLLEAISSSPLLERVDQVDRPAALENLASSFLFVSDALRAYNPGSDSLGGYRFWHNIMLWSIYAEMQRKGTESIPELDRNRVIEKFCRDVARSIVEGDPGSSQLRTYFVPDGEARSS
jgi:hypothetical protein